MADAPFRRFHVFPLDGNPREALLVVSRDEGQLVRVLGDLIMTKRPSWGRSALRVLEYGQPEARWVLDWETRELLVG